VLHGACNRDHVLYRFWSEVRSWVQTRACFLDDRLIIGANTVVDHEGDLFVVRGPTQAVAEGGNDFHKQRHYGNRHLWATRGWIMLRDRKETLGEASWE
jgi:hypothetical protein